MRARGGEVDRWTRDELEIRAPAAPSALPTTKPHRVPQAQFAGNPGRVFDYRLDGAQAALVSRLMKSFPPVEDGFEFGVGINTGFIRDELVADHQLDARYHRLVTGSGISRYGPVRTDGWVMYDADFVKSRGDRGRSLPAGDSSQAIRSSSCELATSA